MKFLWVAGWGLPPEWMNTHVQDCFPGATHTVVPPDPHGGELHRRGRYDRVCGFSLGAFLLLEAEKRDPCGRPLGLLAPFFSFPAEYGLGGKVPKARVRALHAWIRRDPLAALEDFYERAGLGELRGRSTLPYGKDVLLRGLEHLRKGRLAPSWPEHAAGFAGDGDLVAFGMLV